MITTVIGAFPKPKFLNITDWFNTKGGTDTENPTKLYNEEISKMGDNSEELFLKATSEIINDQIDCGIDIVTDGEVRRENYIHYHCRHITGIDFNRLTEKSARTGNYKCWLPTIVTKVEAQDSFLVHDWEVSQKISSRPVKITLPGPMTIADTIANSYYKSEDKMGFDLAEVINIEIKRLKNAGCKYIQIDEPLFARKPQKAIDFGISNLAKCFEGIENDKVEKITHICCGYPDKLDAINYPKAPINSYHKIASQLNQSIINTVSLEDAHRYNDLSLLEKFSKTKIILGLIKIASSKEETINEIHSRILNALQFIKKENLIAAPDCGLGHLPRDLAKRKLKIMVDAVKNI
ncbi:5-methyltetrahydropteroyltriglutamate--homocysteine methyltransferase [Alphaproteobacteria bacterium]|nr:5-methyltetrahydropteroyltriglutamate--homocysteine methyltransferase [Alphaproteobacteria bacterium]